MDATTIQEIANQLGIAADKVTDLIPQFAQGYIWTDITYISIASIVFLLALGTFIGSLIYKNKIDKWSDAPFVYGIIFGIIALIVILTIGYYIADLICWINIPEAKFMNHILEMI